MDFYGRPLLQAWLLPSFNTIPNNCVRDNSLQLCGYCIGFSCTRSLIRILPGPYISAMHLFICFFVTDFIRKAYMVQLSVLLNKLFFCLFETSGSGNIISEDYIYVTLQNLAFLYFTLQNLVFFI